MIPWIGSHSKACWSLCCSWVSRSRSPTKNHGHLLIRHALLLCHTHSLTKIDGQDVFALKERSRWCKRLYLWSLEDTSVWFCLEEKINPYMTLECLWFYTFDLSSMNVWKCSFNTTTLPTAGAHPVCHQLGFLQAGFDLCIKKDSLMETLGKKNLKCHKRFYNWGK